jgi:hypothetical protein
MEHEAGLERIASSGRWPERTSVTTQARRKFAQSKRFPFGQGPDLLLATKQDRVSTDLPQMESESWKERRYTIS